MPKHRAYNEETQRNREEKRSKVPRAPHDQFMNAFPWFRFFNFFFFVVRSIFLFAYYLYSKCCLHTWISLSIKLRCFLNESSRNVECNAVVAVFLLVVVFACVIIVSDMSLVSLLLLFFPFHSSNFLLHNLHTFGMWNFVCVNSSFPLAWITRNC